MGWLDKVENQRIEEEKQAALRRIEQDKKAVIKDAEMERKRLEYMEAKARYDATVEALMPALKDITTIAEITAERAQRLGIQVFARYYSFTEKSKLYPYPIETEWTYHRVQLYNPHFIPDYFERSELRKRGLTRAGESAVEISVNSNTLGLHLSYTWCPVPEGKRTGDDVPYKHSQDVAAAIKLEELTPDRLELLLKWVHRPHRLDVLGKEEWSNVAKQPISYRAGRWLSGLFKG